MHTPPAQTVWRIALPRNTAAVPAARALVRTVLESSRGRAVYCDTAELLTAELVANALEHSPADGPVELTIRMLPEGCRVEVHDGGPLPPGPLALPGPPNPSDPPDPWQEHGRGLLLLRTLSSSCGLRPTASGKAVWFTLSSLPGPRRQRG